MKNFKQPLIKVYNQINPKIKDIIINTNYLKTLERWLDLNY